MIIKLSNAEIEELKEAHKDEKNGKKRDRIKAILMLAKGYSAGEIADILMININTITGWKNRYLNRKDGMTWLLDRYSGYQGKLSKAEEEIVSKYVSENIVSDSKQVQQFIYQEFGILYSSTGIKEPLHRMRFTYKQTTLIPAKYDAEKQAEFKRFYEEFKDNLKEDEAILFLDGVHPQHNTKCTHAWIKTGEEKTIKSNSGRKRLNIEGAYNPETQDIIFNEVKTINGENIILNLKKIEAFYPNKATIYAIADGAGYYHCKEVQDFLKTSRIEIIKLPAYSPNLNLIERLWKLLRKKTISNTYYEKFKDFKASIFEFLNDNSQEFKTELRQFIGFKLHLLDSS